MSKVKLVTETHYQYKDVTAREYDAHWNVRYGERVDASFGATKKELNQILIVLEKMKEDKAI